MTERKYTFSPDTLEKLSTPELEGILRTELDSSNPDRETIMFVLSILEDRDPTDSGNRPAGAYEALENVVEKQRSKLKPRIAVDKARSGRIRSIIAVAAMVALILLLTVPQAVGAESFLEIIGRWTQDLFSFFESDAPQPQPQPQPREYGLQSENEDLIRIYNATLEIGISDPLVPTWLPEGYALQEYKIFETARRPKIYARFSKEDKYLQISIELFKQTTSNFYPKDDINANIIASKGMYYYIFSNDDSLKAIWTDDHVEYMIVTNDALEVLTDVLKTNAGGTS